MAALTFLWPRIKIKLFKFIQTTRVMLRKIMWEKYRIAYSITPIA